MKIYHAVITLFNVRAKPKVEWPKSEDWMNKRLDIFEQYCYPSICAQSKQDFDWYFYVDDIHTPESIRKRISGYARIIPIYINTNKLFEHNHLINSIKEKLVGHQYLATTTLDCDDSLHRKFIEFVRNKIKPVEFQILCLSSGYRYFVGEPKIWLMKHWKGNGFFTMVEKISSNIFDLKTCRFRYSHAQICQSLFSKYVSNIRTEAKMWIHFIHDLNTQTEYRKGSRWKNLTRSAHYIPLSIEQIQKDFGIKLEIPTLPEVPGKCIINKPLPITSITKKRKKRGK